MQGLFAILTFITLIIMVLCRAAVMKHHGLNPMQFGKTDKTDFFILPFVLFFAYHIFACGLGWPNLSGKSLYENGAVRWMGVLFCTAGLALFLWGLVSFGQSFRVGIDEQSTDKLVTSGAFAVSRNPLYTAFALNLVGFFLIFPNWLFGVYLIAGAWLFRRQVLREEVFLSKHYGTEFETYCQKVRRYL